jgi:hypothetical protein
MEERKMIRIAIHPTTPEGKPLPGEGRIAEGNDVYELIEVMKMKSPFTADMSERQYIDNVLSKVLPEGKSTELDAAEFLTKLAEKGLISFLPDEPSGENYEEEK